MTARPSWFLNSLLGALLLVFAGALGLEAQQPAQVTGQVVDASGQPIINANVTINALGIGTSTNREGRYLLTVSGDRAQGQEVEVRAELIGRRAETTLVTLAPGGSVIANFTLEDDPLRVEGITVTALGIERQARTLSSATQQLGGAELTRVEPNLVNALSGKVAGVNITNSGTQGGSSRIVVRGENSITGYNQPLFIVDGIPVDNSIGGISGILTDQGGFDYGNAVQDIMPEDIESLTVLKGPNAAALYGSRASNGAIIIETKSGRNTPGGAQLVVSQQVTFEDELKLPNYQNEYGQGSYGLFSFYDGYSGGVNDGFDESWGPPLDQGLMIPQWHSDYNPATDSREPLPWVSNPDNVDNFFDVGTTLTTNVSVSGSNDLLNGRASFSRMDLDGMAPGHALERNNFSFSGGIQASDRLRVSSSVQYTQAEGENRPGIGYGEDNPMGSFIWFGRQVDTKRLKELHDQRRPAEEPLIGGFPYAWNTLYWLNPYWTALKNQNLDKRNRLLGQVSVAYEVNDWLTAMVRTGTDWYEDFRTKRYVQNPSIPLSGYYTTSPVTGAREFVTENGSFGDWTIGFQESNTDFLLTANPDLGLPVTTNFTFGGNRRDFERTNDYTWVSQLASPGTFDVSNAAITPDRTTLISRKRVNSLYGQLELGYNNYAFLTFTGRNDWSSTLPEENRSFFYPSVSGSYVFTDAMADTFEGSFLSYGKLRASWAEVGNDTDPYRLRNTFSAGDIWGGSIPSFSVPGRLENPNLKPEITESIEFGAELAFFDNRLGLDVTYYNEETRDQLMPVSISRTTGYSSRMVNAGVVENKGWEVLVRGTPVVSDNFRWETTLTWSKNDNTVVELAPGVDGLEMSLGDFWFTSLFARPGEEMGQLVGNKYRRSPDGEIIVHAGLGIPLWTQSPQPIGNVHPDFRTGLANEFTFNDVRFNVLLDWQQGGDIYSVTKAFGRFAGVLEETVEGRCIPGGPARPGYPVCDENTGIVVDGVNEVIDENGNTTYVENTTVVDAQTYWLYNFFVPENNLEDATYVKVREASVSYSLPGQWTDRLRVNAVDLSLVGRNLFLWTKADHLDPETSMEGTNVQGFEYGQMPSARSVGLNVTVRP